MAQVSVHAVIDYSSFRTNPGPQLEQASNGRPVLVVKGRQKFIVLDAGQYDDIIERLEQLERRVANEQQRTGTDG